MSEKNSFDQLATEILLDIFDYLSYNDIIYTFFNLNRRFNSILLQNYRFSNTFTTPVHNLSFWQNILPMISSQIECLIITTMDFFVSLDTFPNLKSLIISSSLPIECAELISTLGTEQFKKLNSFKIKSEIVDTNLSYARFLFDNILNAENSFSIFESFPELYLSSFKTTKNVHLQSISLKVTDVNCLYALLNVTPNLKYLNAELIAIILLKRPTPNIDLSIIKLKKISITVRNCGMNHKVFLFLTGFIKQFSSSLVYLSLLHLNQNYIPNDDFNGTILQQQLLESMIELKSFHLYMQLDQIPRNIESFLSKFKMRFCLDHHWAFGIYKTYLFTLPFHFDKLKDYINFDEIISSNPTILNSTQTWSHVKSIDLPKSTEISSSLIKQMKLKMPNLSTISIAFEQMKTLMTNDDQTDITLDSIITVRCENEFLQTIKQWLVKIFPNTRHIELYYGAYSLLFSADKIILPQKLDDEYSGEQKSKVEFVKIKLTFEDLDICTHVIYLVKKLLEIFRNLPYFTLMFYQMNEFPHINPFTDLNKTIQLLKMEKFSEKYYIKDNHNYLQFIRKDNESGFPIGEEMTGDFL